MQNIVKYMDSGAEVIDESRIRIEEEQQEEKERTSSLVIEKENSNTVQEEEKKKEIMSEIFSKLPAEPEIMLEIFSRLRPKTIYKFKCVCKSVYNLTKQAVFAVKHSQNCKAIGSSPFTGFFYQSKLTPQFLFNSPRVCFDDKEFGKPEFVAKVSKAGGLPDPSLGFLKQKSEDDTVELIDSCNGLLLCSNTPWTARLTKTYFVCNPLSKERVVLPHPRRRSNRVFYALLADLTESGYLQYKVVCVFRPKHGDSCSKLSILSSETGEWEEIFYLRLPALCDESLMGSRVFFKGSLFWDCLEGHILVCHLHVKKSQCCYELIEAPRAPLGRCLWKFKDTLLCCCHGFPDEFPAWSLCINDKKELEWTLSGCEEFEILTEDICNKYSENMFNVKKVKPRIHFKIIAYSPESKMMFLWIPDSIFTYEFSERRLELVWGYRLWKFHSPSCVFPYVHSLAPIQIGKIPEGNQEGDSEEDDTTELISLYENWANNTIVRHKTDS